MVESFDTLSLPGEKQARYAALAVEIDAVIGDEVNEVARMATVAAMLAQSFDSFLWTGFYLVDQRAPGQLVIGPYQGRLGCLRIAIGKGVCGAAAARGETVIVPDVEAFAGHIVCDSRSRSEIVAPVFGPGGDLIGVLDIDSAELAAFDEVDASALEAILQRAFATRR